MPFGKYHVVIFKERSGSSRSLRLRGWLGVAVCLVFCLLVAGIVAICTRNGGKGGYVSAGFYIVGGLIGLLCAGSYADLNIWSGLSIFFGILCIVGSRKQQ